jgi:glutathione S-transferase
MLELYGHPFSSFTWKPLIALYERDVPFTFHMVDPGHPNNQALIAQLSPTGQFPALVDGDRQLTQSNALIEYIDLHHGGAAPLVPEDPREAIEARMMADVFDDYVNVPLQRIVGEAFRPDDAKDPHGVAKARATLDKAYAWLETKLADRTWAMGNRFSIADCAAAPALFYADWVHPLPEGELSAFRARLLARESVVRVVNEARPYRKLFPLGAPDRD